MKTLYCDVCGYKTKHNLDEYGIVYNDDKTILFHCPPKTYIKNLALPLTVTKIYQSAFEYNTHITSVYGLNVTRIQECAFFRCKELESATFPSVEWIGADVFYNCNRIRELSFKHKHLKNIEPGAFSNCENLEHVILGENVNNIPAFCFSNCVSLKAITLYGNHVKINKNAFKKCNNIKIFTENPLGTIIYLGETYLKTIATKNISFKCISEFKE